jgi:DNA polymerase delta subunit 1
MPSLVPSAKRLVDDGFSIPTGQYVHGQTFESNVPFVLRFMIDNEISGADWVEFPAAKYSVRRPAQCVTRCTLEVDVTYDNLVHHECTGIWSTIAPIRILSFDIECQGRKGHFPDAQFDPVIQIANVVMIQGQEQPLIRSVFTLNTCLPIVGANVNCSETEIDMLLKWRSFVIACDPDLITGYNIANFDFPYLLNRAKVSNFLSTSIIWLLINLVVIGIRESKPQTQRIEALWGLISYQRCESCDERNYFPIFCLRET